MHSADAPTADSLLIRATGDPFPLGLPRVRKPRIAGLAPNLPNLDVRLLSDAIDPQLQPYRIGAVLFTAFGLLALGLAAIGLYGVVTYVVAQRDARGRCAHCAGRETRVTWCA